MINLVDLKEHYPPKLQVFSLGILREYLQYKILESIYKSKFSEKLVFLGGTALRIVYDNQRFSEDLDFDNLSLSEDDFEELSQTIKKSLELEGYSVEIRTVYKQAFHCYIKIPDLLFKEGLSNRSNQKVTIRIDTTPQNYEYKPEVFLLDGFGVYQNIQVVSKELLLAQKFAAILGRKRAKGRDYFDISYLFSKGVDLDMGYIKERLGYASKLELKKAVEELLTNINLKGLAKDVKPFLFDSSHVARVIDFKKQLEKLD